MLSAGAMIVASAAPAGAEPDGMLATTEFGVRFLDESRTGQCVVDDGSAGDSIQWVPEGQWTVPLAIDADNRHQGCRLWFGFNNSDGSLTGFNLSYTYAVSPGGDAGQCPFASGQPTQVPIFPLAFNYRLFMDPPIVIDTDGRSGWCDLTLQATGRADVALDVLYEFNGDGGQCKGALAQGWGQPRTVRTGELPVTIGFDTDNRGGACFLSFRLRHV